MRTVIDTLPLRRFTRLYAAVMVTGNQIHESIFIDIAAGLLRFSTPIGAGQIALDIKESDAPVDAPGFFLPGERFFDIIDAYPEIVLEDDTIVTRDGRFDLGALREEHVFPSFSESLPSQTRIGLGPEGLGKRLAVAAPFAAKDTASPTCGVFIKKNHIIGTDHILVYDEPISEAMDDVNIPLGIAQAALALPLPEIVLSWKDGLIRIEAPDGSLKMNAATAGDLDPPDPTEPMFRSAFDHDTVVQVSRLGLIEILKFFESFAKTAPFNRVQISTQSETELTVEIIDGAKAVRRLPAVVDPRLVGDRFLWFSQRNILKALETIAPAERAIIAIDYDAVALDVRAEDIARHIIVTSLRE